ncbi:unnamed protein product [Ectocarpus sp. CCAP 1310/34]|nr:unnamed protein product [Ectocarpus sp. CCAP 1310/34]
MMKQFENEEAAKKGYVNDAQELIAYLQKTECWLRFKVDNEGRITCIVWAHQQQMAMAMRYHSVIIQDNTFNTNIVSGGTRKRWNCGNGSGGGGSWERPGGGGVGRIRGSGRFGFIFRWLCAFFGAGGAAGGVVPQQPLPAVGGNDEEEDDSNGNWAPTPIPIPHGLSLNKTSWCCGRTETIRSICGGCNRRWHCHIAHGLIDMDKDRFTCCFCDSPMRAAAGCSCHKCVGNARYRTNSATRAQGGHVRASAVDRTAGRRKPTTSVFKLKPDPLLTGDSSSGWQKAVYSVSTTTRGERVTVVTNFIPNEPGSYKIVCCSSQCISTTHAQEPDPAENVQRMAVARCDHAIVVVGSGTLPVPRAGIRDATPVVFGKNGEGVVALADKAAQEMQLGQSGLSDVLRMAAMAEEHDMPLLVHFSDTRSYAVYHPGHRSIAEGWAVVQCEIDLQDGAGGARRSRRTPAKRSSQSFRCKANGGTPCGAARKSKRGRCVHTNITALGVMGSQISEEPIDEEEGEGSGDEGVGSAASEYRRNKPAFASKVDKLLRVIGTIKFPVEVLAVLTDEGARGSLDGVGGKRKEICSLQAVCQKCGNMLGLLRSETITAVVPGPDLQEVVIKIKGCEGCGVEAVTGDDWREHGYFLFGNKVAVHLSHMVTARHAVQGGTAISHASNNLLRPLTNNLRWMSQNKLARRVLQNYLTKQLVDAFVCFEALPDHPYAFRSCKHGYTPLVSEGDGCNKPAVNISMEEYFGAREEQVVDMDLDWLWLIISMLSPMVFRETLQFSYNTPVTFCPQNRKSNIITIPARGKARQPGDVEAADGKVLMDYVATKGEGQLLEDMLEGMTKDDLDALYCLCFGKNGPGMSRLQFAGTPKIKRHIR